MSDALDDALERLAGTRAEFGIGLANHGPMAAEAMVELGRPEEVAPWVEAYLPRLESPGSASTPIGDADWRDALGDPRRGDDWIVFFRRQLRDHPWTDVVGTWSPRLAPGWVRSACHGTIRAAHAVRACERAETKPRLEELARAFAYWAASYQAMPAAPRLAGTATPLDAMAEAPLLGVGRRPSGLIAGSLLLTADLDGFDEAGASVAPGAEPEAALSAVTEAAALTYLANAAPRRGRWIALVHAITGPSALRLLLPHLAPADRPAAVGHAWHAAFSLHAAFSDVVPVPPPEPLEVDRDDLVGRAVDDGDEHVIKVVEACLREHDARPSPAFLAVAAAVTHAAG